MHKLTVEIHSGEGKLLPGVYEGKEILKVISKDEFDDYSTAGYITDAEEAGRTGKASLTKQTAEATVEELFDMPREELNKAQLSKISEYYKLPTSGTKAEITNRIDHFESLLETDIDALSDEELKLLAEFAGIDTALDRDAMIEAIEEASE